MKDKIEEVKEDVGYIDIYVNVGTLRNQHISTQAIVKKIVSITNTGSLGGSGTNNNEYLHGDVFNSSFIRVTKTYSDGTTEENQIPVYIGGVSFFIEPANGALVYRKNGDRPLLRFKGNRIRKENRSAGRQYSQRGSFLLSSDSGALCNLYR